MTLAELQALPDDELTNLAATQVMGWKKSRPRYICERYSHDVWAWVSGVDRFEQLATDTGDDTAWNPLENIADAWVMVERLRECHQKSVFVVAEFTAGPTYYSATVNPADRHAKSIGAGDASIGRAIVLAALLATV